MTRQRAKILLVDDSESDQVIVQRAFEKGKINCDIDICTNGKEALTYLLTTDKNGWKQNCPDLILMDINMPVMDGKQTLEAIRKNSTLNHLPVVMLTTSSREKDVIESYQLGVNAYIKKPVDHLDFIKIVQKLEHFWLELVVLPPKLTT